MKKLGLIGGTGPESTVAYYRQIEYGVQAKTGRFPNLVIESLSVFDVLDYCERQEYDGLASYLLNGFSRLADAGADFACLTGITPHIVFDRIARESEIPVVSMVDAACEYAARKGYGKLALLGTYPTMNGTFFQKPFQKHGIKVATPSEQEKRYMGEKIETELELNKVIPETQAQFCAIAERLVREENVEAVVLGCTELPLILTDGLLSVPCMDVMKIHIDKLIELIIDEAMSERDSLHYQS